MWITKPELDLVINGDALETKEEVLSLPRYPRFGKTLILDSYYVLGQFSAKRDHTITLGECIEGDGLQSWVTRHLDMGAVKGDRFRERGTTIKAPLDEKSVLLDFLLALQPFRHLGIFVTAIRGAISILGHVDVEAFGELRIVIIRRTEKFDGWNIVP